MRANEHIKWILVTGASSDLTPEEVNVSRQVGYRLAREGYGLIVGDWDGVDWLVREAFLSGIPVEHQANRIKHVANFDRHDLVRIPDADVLPDSGQDWGFSFAAISLADAGIIISGREGSKPSMDALVDNGKPVLPIPFLGWDAFAIYRDILENWNESPVCGLTERQYLELMKPWRRNPVTLFRLLKAALATEPEIFISYRRDDNPVAAGRLFDELAHSYGQNLVFIDYAGLLGGQALEDILTKVEQSRVLLLVVGDNWITERLEDPTDYVRREIIAAQKNGLRVIPVLAGHTARPAVQQIPEPLQFILNLKFLPLQMDDWEVGVNRLKQTIDDVVL